MMKFIYNAYKNLKLVKRVVTTPTTLVKTVLRDLAIKKAIQIIVEDVLKTQQKNVEFINKHYSFTLPTYLNKIGHQDVVAIIEDLLKEALTFTGDLTGYNTGSIKIKLVEPLAQSDDVKKQIEIDLKLGLIMVDSVDKSPVETKNLDSKIQQELNSESNKAVSQKLTPDNSRALELSDLQTIEELTNIERLEARVALEATQIVSKSKQTKTPKLPKKAQAVKNKSVPQETQPLDHKIKKIRSKKPSSIADKNLKLK